MPAYWGKAYFDLSVCFSVSCSFSFLLSFFRNVETASGMTKSLLPRPAKGTSTSRLLERGISPNSQREAEKELFPKYTNRPAWSVGGSFMAMGAIAAKKNRHQDELAKDLTGKDRCGIRATAEFSAQKPNPAQIIYLFLYSFHIGTSPPRKPLIIKRCHDYERLQ